MAYNESKELSFLSRTEIEWLSGNKQLSTSYNRKIKSPIRKKIKNFQKFELPLLLEKGPISLTTVTKFSNDVTKYSNTQTKALSKLII